MTLFWTILGMGVVTFGIRALPLTVLDKVQMPGWLSQGLQFVPPAVLTAIIFPDLFLPGGAPAFTLANPRLWAGVVAALAAWRFKNIMLTVIAGMGTLWLLQFFWG